MANVTGDTVQEVSDQLTSVWNNFYDGSHSLEYYIDVMTELGAATASSSSEIADGLQDFAAIAGMIGLDFDRAATMIATTASVSRQSADVIGTSFRSIFSRIQGLQMGETLEDGVDLNKYSTALQKVGIDVLDASGNLRDMNSILDEMGAKWQELSQTEQTALAQTVAGVWQYNNLVTLMDNWDTFEQNLSIAQNSAGTLEEQSQIYEESWVAASNRVKASLEDVYNSILDSDTFKGILDNIADTINLFDTFIDSIGGLPGVLALVGALGTKVFREQLGDGIEYAVQGIYSLTGVSKTEWDALRQQANEMSELLTKQDAGTTAQQKAWNDTQKLQLDNYQRYFEIAEKLSDVDLQRLNIAMETNEAFMEQYNMAAKNQDDVFDNLRYNLIPQLQLDSDAGDSLLEILDTTPRQITEEYQKSAETIKQLTSEAFNSSNIEDFKRELNLLSADLIDFDNNTSRALSNIYENLGERFNIEEVQQQIRQATQNFSIDSIFKNIADETETFFKDLIDNDRLSEESIPVANEVVNVIRSQLSDVTNEFNSAMNNVFEGNDSLKRLFTNLETSALTRASEGVVAFGNAILDTTVAIMSLQSAWSTLNNEDASFFEKALSIMMALGTALPAMIELLRSLELIQNANIKQAIQEIQQKIRNAQVTKQEEESTRALNREKEKEAALRATNAEMIDNENKKKATRSVSIPSEQHSGTIVSLGNNAENAEKKVSKLSGTFSKFGKGVTSIFGNIGRSIGALIPGLRELIIVTAVMSAASAVISQISRSIELFTRDWEQYDLDQANQSVTNLTQSYNDLNTELNNFSNDVSVYQETRNGLDSLIEGTDEYAEKTKEANEAALTLIQTYSDRIEGTDWSIENGEIIISPESIEALDQAMQIDVENAQTAVLLATQNQNEATTRNSIVDGAEEFASRFRGLDNVLSGVENATLFGGEIYESAFRQLVQLVAEDQTILNSPESIQAALEQVQNGTEFENDKLVNALYDAREDINELSNSIRADTESRENTYQQNANAALERLGLSNQGLEDVGGRVYGNLVKQITEETINSLGENYQQILQDYYNLTAAEAADATYDSANRILSYTDNEGNSQELTAQQIASTVASIEANEKFEDSMLSLNTEMQQLSRSTDIADQSLLSFLQNGNLEDLSRQQYNKLVSTVDYDAETGSYNNEQVDTILGLTGTKAENEARAAEYGYASANAMREAFIEGLNVDWELPEGIKDEISNFLSIGNTQTIRDNYKLLGNQVGNAYIEGLNEIYDSIDWSNLTTDESLAIWDNIINYDWENGSVEDLQYQLQALGAEIDYDSEAWQNFIQASQSAFEYTIPSVETLYENFQAIHEVIDDISIGDILSDEDYQRLVNYNSELEKYFITLANGDHQLIGDPLDLQQDIRATEMAEYEQTIRNYQGAIEDLYQNQDIVGYLNTVNSSTRDLGETVDKTTESWKQLASQQLSILQSGGYDSEQISDWRSRLGSNELNNDDLRNISEAVRETETSMQNSLDTVQQYNEQMQGAMNILAMMSDEDEASEYFKSGAINYSAYAASAQSRIQQDRYENVDVEEIQDYSDYLQEAADSSEILSDELINNSEAAEEVALATARMNTGMDTLIDNWDTWGDVLRNSSKESEEYAEAIIGVKNALSDVLGVQESFISNDFIERNLSDIEAAVQGETDAIDRLKMALGEDIILQVTMDDSDAQQKALSLHNRLMSMIPDIQVGATLNDEDFINGANELIAAAGMTYEEAQGYFNSIGYTPVFETKSMPMTTYMPEYEARLTDVSVGYNDEDGNWHFAPGVRYTVGQVGQTAMTTDMDVPILYNEQGKDVTASGTGTPRLKGLISTGGHSGGRSSGGRTMSNYSPRNAGGASPYSPSDSGGNGGGSGSDSEDEPTPSEPMDYTDIEELRDRYYEITDSLDDMTDALDDAADAADRLYGKNRIAAMEQQRDLMEQQRDLLQQYRSEIEAYLAKDKAALENNEYGIHFTFDADGDITNYTQIMTDLYNQLHAAEQTYNSFATKEEQDAYQESTLDPLNKKIEEIKNLIDTYDNTQDLLVDVDNQIRDALNEWQDQNYEILTYKIELQIEINDLEQERLDYYLNKYEDDFYKMAESMALTGDSFPLLTNNLATYKNEMEQLNQAYHNGEISQNAFIEGMKEVNSGLLENMNALVDLDREMLQYYENTLDSAEDKLSDFTDQLEHQMSILEHYQNVLGLIGKEQDYQMVGAVLQGQFSVAQDQLAAQEHWVETLRNQMADIQSDLLSAVDEKEREALNEQLLLVTQRLNEAEESVNSLRESVLELAQSILENDLANYAQQLSENLVEGLGFGNLDEYLDTIDKLNTSQEEYLTTTNKVYETNKLIRQAQEDMAENDSLLAKQRYKEYIDYVEQLQEQGRLSKYELRIAQARYEVLQAQIALEEAQNAKDTMRLVRDSQGNYNYVYTANQDNISQAQQALEDAENNLYNIGLEGAQNYQDKYAQILEEAFNAFKDLSEQYKNGEITSEEVFNQKRLELQNYYYNRLKDIQDLYYIAHDLLVNESFTNEADYLFAGIGNLEDFKDATDQYLQDCNNAFDEWQENTEVATDSVGNGMGDLQDHIQDVTDTSSDLTDQIQDDLIPALEDELEAVRDMTNLWLSHRDALYETLQAYEELQQGAQNTISSAAGVQPGGVLPDIPEEYQADIGAIMAAYLQQGGSINDDLFQQLWNKRNEKIEWLAANGYSSSYWGSYGEETIKGFEELVSGGGDQDWYDYAANMYTIEQIREFLQQMGLPTFKTGGYTGSWGPSGRLAIIHEKELILNQDDTNSLINIIREYGKLKSNNINSMDIFNSSFNDIITKFKSIINKINFNNQDRIAAQQVSIEASFPNVSVASEIEDAFNDLLNRAAQYVSLNRTNY